MAAQKKTTSADGSTHSDICTLSYEEAMVELEQLVSSIESGNVPLDESVRQYKRGAVLVKRCREILEAARTEVERIATSDLTKHADA